MHYAAFINKLRLMPRNAMCQCASWLSCKLLVLMSLAQHGTTRHGRSATDRATRNVCAAGWLADGPTDVRPRGCRKLSPSLGAHSSARPALVWSATKQVCVAARNSVQPFDRWIRPSCHI